MNLDPAKNVEDLRARISAIRSDEEALEQPEEALGNGWKGMDAGLVSEVCGFTPDSSEDERIDR